jgi:hypothetical protein
VTAADVNGDGEPDLIVANFGSDKRARSQAKSPLENSLEFLAAIPEG